MKIESRLNVDEPIVALSSAPGPGARAIVRLTGDSVFALVRSCFQPRDQWPEMPVRGRLQGNLTLADLNCPLPAEVLIWPAPRTYTGQDLVEIHTLSSPPLVEALIAQLLRLGARGARPGEFTLRAFLAGKLDLTQAEAVLSVIEAGDGEELKTALAQLAGNLARPLHRLRDDLLNLLAEVEAGLDFAEEDLPFISRRELCARLQVAERTLTDLKRRLEGRSVSGRPFRVVLIGPPNTGKSSLFNALCGDRHALVSPQPGTTRDYLRHRLEIDGVPVELIDTAGQETPGAAGGPGEREIRADAQQARALQAAEADLLLACHDASRPGPFPADHRADARVLPIWTKCDAGVGALTGFQQTSARTGEGLDELRRVLVERARPGRRGPAVAPSWSRCRHHVEAALQHLTHAQAVVERYDPPELLALELRLALEQLGEMVGEVYTDDLLDRIFGQFCIGK